MREKVKQEATPPHRAGMIGSPAIELRALCKAFGTLQAVDHLTLSVEQGEIFGLLGPNGSGKTTTINLISGLSTPTSGEVPVMGYQMPRHARSIRQMLGAVPQETALYEELSAWDNLDFHDPLLLYLDEPTLGVDVQSRRAIWDYILSLRDQGKTALITTNYLEEAQALCERIAILDHGKLIAADTPEHLKQTYGGSVVELETAQLSTVLDDLRALAGVQAVLQEGTHLQITLAALGEGNNPLTSRERDVLTASLFGASMAEIAARLVLSEGTVHNHLSTAMQKLGARNRMEAARLAEQKGWL